MSKRRIQLTSATKYKNNMLILIKVSSKLKILGYYLAQNINLDMSNKRF